MNLPPPPALQQQRRLFQPMSPPWWAVGGGLATTAAVELIKLPISCLFFHAWWLHRLYYGILYLVVDWSWLISNRGCPPPNQHRGGGRTTVQPPQPHLVVSSCDGATTSEASGWYMLASLDETEHGYRMTWTW
nr:hypothetical protein [Tanacetum cinerariifolium]